MRAATVSAALLWLALSVAGTAAEPPAPTAAPPPTSSSPPGASATPNPGAATAHPPAAGSEPATEPDRIDPTEKVHSDSEISFPVDI